MGFVPLLSSTAPRRTTTSGEALCRVGFLAGGSQVVASCTGDLAHAARCFMAEDLVDDDDSAMALPLHLAPKRDALPLALAVQDDFVVIAFDSAEALLFSAISLGFEKTLTRLTTPIHAVQFRPRPANRLLRPHQEVAVAGEDAEIRIINIDDIKQAVSIKGHTETIKSLEFSPDGDFLASVDTLGDLHVWDLRGPKPVSHRVLRSALPASNVESKDMGRISWHPSGKFIAIPGLYKEVNILDTKTWASVATLPNHSKSVTAVQYSHDGHTIASTDQSGKMYFWSSSGKEKTPFKTVKNPAVVTDFAWHPTKNDVVMVTDAFEMEYLQDVGGTTFSTTETTTTDSEKQSIIMDFDTAVVESSKPKRAMDGFSESRPKKHRTETRTSTLLEDIDMSDEEDFNDFVVDDDGMGYANKIETAGDARKYYRKQVTAAAAGRSGGYGGFGGGIVSSGVECQESFQPGATPLKGNKKYLAFNLLGLIYTVEQPSQSVIHISHHDKSHRDFSYQDHYHITMAALNSRGAVFASDPNSPLHKDSPRTTSIPANSVIEYKPFDNWASGGGSSGGAGGWTIHMSPNESVKAVCLTSRGVVVATDLRYLRFISFSGIQTDVRCLEGNVVALCGEGEWLGVVYHRGGTFHGDQNLGYLLMRVNAKGVETVRKEGVPVSPSSVLSWVGFSDSNCLVTYDSSGVLRMMSPYDDYAWRPIFDARIARDGKQLHYWPIGVTEKQFMCVICKSGDKHPFPPKSIISDMDLRIPMLMGEGLSPVEEEGILRARINAAHAIGTSHVHLAPKQKERDLKQKLETDVDKQVVHQIVAACKQEKSLKALELAQTLTSIKSINGALKVAVGYGQSSLANKINQVKEEFLKNEEDEKKRVQAATTVVTRVVHVAAPAAPEAPVHIKPEALAEPVAVANPKPAKSAILPPTPSAPIEPVSHTQPSTVVANDDDYTQTNDFEDDRFPEETPAPAPEVVAPKSAKSKLSMFGATPLKSAATATGGDGVTNSPAPRVKNPFSVSAGGGGMKGPVVNVGSSSGVYGGKVGSVGALFQDLKDTKEAKDAKVAAAKVVKEEHPVTAVPKGKEQSKLSGFFFKQPSTATTPSKEKKAEPVVPSAPESDDSDMQLDAALDELKSGNDVGSETVAAAGKENASCEFPERTWEEKGKSKVVVEDVAHA
ncbi:hypothetical protein HDU98_011807 [Podochytrium sp. JEL0797]|nr:hypothetical protein HDU98_011807 [Podochytrium sp. JEL0797]